MDTLVITQRPVFWKLFTAEFTENRLNLITVSSVEGGLERIRSNSPVLVVLDVLPESKDMKESELTRYIRQVLTEILTINAMIHSVVVSSLDEKTFHDATEGLGVLLHLSEAVEKTERDSLFTALKAVQCFK